MKFNIKVLLFIIGISLWSNSLYSQNLFNDSKRAEYIFSFSQNVSWQKLESEKFTIGILDNDSLLFYTLKIVADSIKTIHSKPIEIKVFSTESEIQDCNVIFIANSKSYSIDKVRDVIKSKQILLLSEDFPFHKSMINFTVINGKRKYEINEEYLLQEHLQISPLLLSFSVKTKDAWENLYATTEHTLISSQKENIEKDRTITKQTEEITENKIQIENLIQSIKAQKKELEILSQSIAVKQKELNQTNTEITKGNDELEIQKLQLQSLQKNIAEQQKILKEQSNQIHTQVVQIDKQTETIQNQGIIITLFIIIFILVLVFTYLIIRQFRITKKINSELEIKNNKISKQRDKIAEQNKHITDSIMYAQRIQHAILPPEEIIAQNVPDHFILFKPRDIVSGDYYWMTQIDDIIIVTAADCTGHGVPGAFMSLLGITFLNEIVHEKRILQPHKILNELRIRIKESLNKEGNTEEYKDGMDMAICMIHKNSLELEYSGAYNSLYIIRDKNIEEIKADKMPVGLSGKMDESFNLQKTQLQKGDSFYMFSDGYVDQFGGPHDRKFMIKQLKELLISIQDSNMDEQKNILNNTIENWKGKTEQVDDILIIGIQM